MRVDCIRLNGLKSITLPLTSGSYSPLVTAASPSDKYILDSVDGLGPGDVNVAIASTAGGGNYQGRELVPRQIIMNLKLNPNWWTGETAADLRLELYHMLSTGYDPHIWVQLLNTQGSTQVIAQAKAYVSKIEPILFSKDPMVQLTLDCLDAHFSDPNRHGIDATQLDRVHPSIENIGSAEAGFQMSIRFTDDMGLWYIKVAGSQALNMTFNKNFNAGDVLTFSTVPGNTYVHWNKHRGKVTNKMGLLTNSSEYLQLTPGMNHFVCPSAAKWVFRDMVIYRPLYWGI